MTNKASGGNGVKFSPPPTCTKCSLQILMRFVRKTNIKY